MPATEAGSIAGSGDATASTGGTPINASSGVAKADPPAPNAPKTTPTPRPATSTRTSVTFPGSAHWIEKSKTEFL